MSDTLVKQKLLVIVGPTASGKTSLALKLAKKFNGEIVSADSRQIYRGMNIGTAKAPISEMKEIPHNLLDIKNPDEEYTVAEFKRDAIKAIEKITTKKKIPILVGGTGLYIRAVVDNLDIPAVKPNAKLREKLEDEMNTKGLEYLFQELIELDPEAAYIVDGKNPRRVIRALEVAIATGKPFTAQRKKGERLFDALEIGISVPPDKLKTRIEKRADAMVKNGLIREVKTLLKKYGLKPIAFDAIGYKEIIDALEGKTTMPEAIELIKKKTWAFARRQMTWFRKDKEIQWVKNEKEALGLVRRFLA